MLYYDFYAIHTNNLLLNSPPSPDVPVILVARVHGCRVLKTRYAIPYYDFYAIYTNNLLLNSPSSPDVQVTLAARVHGCRMMKTVFEGRVLKTRYVIL